MSTENILSPTRVCLTDSCPFFFEKISEESEQLHLELCGVHILHILHLSRWILRSLGASPEAHRVICFRPVEPE